MNVKYCKFNQSSPDNFPCGNHGLVIDFHAYIDKVIYLLFILIFGYYILQSNTYFILIEYWTKPTWQDNGAEM